MRHIKKADIMCSYEIKDYYVFVLANIFFRLDNQTHIATIF